MGFGNAFKVWITLYIAFYEYSQNIEREGSVKKTLRSHGRWLEEGPRNTIEIAMTHPNHAYFLWFCEEGLRSSMFLTGGRLFLCTLREGFSFGNMNDI